jgi:Asp-tRNA(Asn)/Glu-tRNA(Gln) amidotransferase B subunit
MMSGDKQTKEDFELLSKNQARQIIRRFINNNDLVEKLVAGIDEDKITGHILKDILSTNFSFDKIKTALEKRIQELKSKDLSTVMSIFLESDDSIKKSDADKEKEKKKFIGYPSNDIE